ASRAPGTARSLNALLVLARVACGAVEVGLTGLVARPAGARVRLARGDIAVRILHREVVLARRRGGRALAARGVAPGALRAVDVRYAARRADAGHGVARVGRAVLGARRGTNPRAVAHTARLRDVPHALRRVAARRAEARVLTRLRIAA